MPNHHVLAGISSMVASEEIYPYTPPPRTKLDIHSNMVVLGKHFFVFDSIHGQTCEVKTFYTSIRTYKQVHIVDSVTAYDCTYSHKTY